MIDPENKKDIIKLIIIALVFSIVSHAAAYLIYLSLRN